ncbi:C-C motif chemokine 15-like [Glossophaga mutica]
MKLSEAALPFLILAAALGPPALGSPARDLGMAMHVPDQSMVGQGGVHHPSDCCLSYTPRNIRCVFMESYYETSGVCSRSAVIFTTRRGQEVCVHPNANGVQDCMRTLASKNTLGRALAEKLQ